MPPAPRLPSLITACLVLVACPGPEPDEPWRLPSSTPAAAHRALLPVVAASNAVSAAAAWLPRVNMYRAAAGVPAVTANGGLSANCLQHARYMAINDHLTHQQDPNLPFASPAGQQCAQQGNAWLGSSYPVPYWRVQQAVDGWIGSVGHRLWLLYPTTAAFGFGFYAAPNNRAGAALDVLSRADFGADAGFDGWPVRYPGPGQAAVPATDSPITLMWPYFGESPTVDSSQVQRANGSSIGHEVTTQLAAGHKGIQLSLHAPLPAGATIAVTVTGRYRGVPFSSTWQFSTAAAASQWLSQSASAAAPASTSAMAPAALQPGP